MDDKIIIYYLILIALCGLSYWLMQRTRKGKIAFFVAFGSFLIVNLYHLNWVKNLPKTSRWAPNLGEAVGYAIATLFEALLLVIFATIWYFVLRSKNTKVEP